jgi:uncharacterized protein DUF5916/cellulose/xylan binding protein with CBM9 domain
MNRPWVPAAAVALCLPCLLGTPARAAAAAVDTTKALAAVRTRTPPRIDGRLDDPGWQEATADDRFTQRFPRDGEAPGERTEVRVLYDDDAVYVGVRMFDSQPRSIVGRLTRRDQMVESDSVQITFDSRRDRATGYLFVLNAAGVQADAMVYDDRDMTFDWDAVWDGAATVDAGGWSAEFRIPLSVLRFSDAPLQDWGFQVDRHISRTQEEDFWSYTPADVRALISQLGHLSGLQGLHPRRTLELRPFVVARASAHTDSGAALFGFSSRSTSVPGFSAGLDAKVGLTSNLTLDATLNPDFGQVEADAVVLNLTRFETFFPEKRPFFLEGADLFSTPLQMFYSRRIGRGLTIADSYVAPDGTILTPEEPPSTVPIRGALKLSGKLGGSVSVGALEALTAPVDLMVRDPLTDQRNLALVPAANYALARAKLASGPSYLGGLATAVTRLGSGFRDPLLDHDGYAQGVDGTWRSVDTRWRLAGQAVASERIGTAYQTPLGTACPHPTGADGCTPLWRTDGTPISAADIGWGMTGEGGYQGKHWDLFARYHGLSPNFDVNDLGYSPDYNQHGLHLDLAYNERNAPAPWQSWVLDLNGAAVFDFDNVPENRIIDAGVNMQFRNFWGGNFDVGLSLPGTWDIWETGDGARFERAEGIHLGLRGHSDQRKPIWFFASTHAELTFGSGGHNLGAYGEAHFDVVPTLQLMTQVDVSWSADIPRMWFGGGCTDDAGAACTPVTVSRHYRIADLSSGSVSITTRLGYTFSPRLSFQGYAQLFLAKGSFANYSRVDTMGLKPYLRWSQAQPDPGFNGDENGDGVKDDDFQEATLNLNLVVRWEPVPGSTLQLVFTRAQTSNIVLGGRAPSFQLQGLSSGPTEDVFLIKFTYFLG